MKTAARIIVSSIAAILLVFLLEWEGVVIYLRHVTGHDPNISLILRSLTYCGFAATLLLAWGFYRWIR
jgi:hypothetical protein